MVIARHRASLEGKQVRPQQVAQELGIRHLLGGVQRQERLRITAAD
jgi:TolB-like protein